MLISGPYQFSGKKAQIAAADPVSVEPLRRKHLGRNRTKRGITGTTHEKITLAIVGTDR